MGRSRRRLLLLLALAAITLLTLDMRGFGPLETVQGFLRDVLHPVASLAATAASPFGNTWNGIFNYGDLEAENRLLKSEIARIKGEGLKSESERGAFKALLEATGITYVADLDTVAATVVRGQVGNFDSHVVTIDRGRRHGIKSGMAVVTGAGMVGRVDRVDSTTATVQLITDPDLRIGVRVISNDEVGLGSAYGDLFRISSGIEYPNARAGVLLPELGSVVVTAALSRYPPGIPIGRVTEVIVDDVLSTVTVDVEFAVDVSDIGYVSVLLAHGVDQVPLLEVVPATAAPVTDGPDVSSGGGTGS